MQLITRMHHYFTNIKNNNKKKIVSYRIAVNHALVCFQALLPYVLYYEIKYLYSLWWWTKSAFYKKKSWNNVLSSIFCCNTFRGYHLVVNYPGWECKFLIWNKIRSEKCWFVTLFGLPTILCPTCMWPCANVTFFALAVIGKKFNQSEIELRIFL